MKDNDSQSPGPGTAAGTPSGAEAGASSGRPRRPKPARTRPLRNASTMFKGDAMAGSAAEITDAVSQGVRLGYSVIAEQIERGRRTAQQFGGRTGQFGDAAGARAAHTGDAASTLNDIGRRFLDFSSDFGAMYVDLLEAAARMPSAARTASAPPAQTSSGEPRASGTRVVIEVDARRPSRVAIDLAPGACGSELGVHALLGADENAEPLTRVTFADGLDGRPLVLQIAIPDDQPPGIYTGVVVDAGNAPWGTLSVTLL